jgi:aspartate aminotransferase-like enzyme
MRAEVAPTVGAGQYVSIERKLAEVLGVPASFVFQGEAMVALEAVARGAGCPGRRALNIVTGPYGHVFGHWLAQQGAEVDTLSAPLGRAMTAERVEEALSAGRSYDIVSVVHAEAATGVVNPLKEIAAAAHRAGAVTVVDAVASVGAEALEIVEWALDIVVVSAQKALAGPAGVTGVAISDAGWSAIASNPLAPRSSVLSLLDWRENWVETDRDVLPLIPAHLETLALGAALDAVLFEGTSSLIARHSDARDRCRRAVRALGLEPWVSDDGEAAAVATTVKVPRGISPAELAAAALGAVRGGLRPPLGVAPAPLAGQALRIGHNGARATAADVLASVAALGAGLACCGVPVDLASALATVVKG